MSSLIQKIEHNGRVLAMIVRAEYSAETIEFLTPNDYSLQIGYMTRPDGYIIKPHLHLPVTREAVYTQEVLFIRKGKIKVDFYDDDKVLLQSEILKKGDVILLICGGHGFEVLEEVDMVEVKQGPYLAEADKERF